MKPYIEWTKEELVAEKARLEQEFAEVKAKGLNLNISRGKPAAAQLDLTEGMLTVLSKNEDTFAEDGTVRFRRKTSSFTETPALPLCLIP